MSFPKAACENHTERWSWCTLRLVANSHLENSIVRQMAAASLKTEGGGKGGNGSELHFTDSKMSVLVSHEPDVGFPKKHTWKSKVSPRCFQQRIWWDGSLEGSFKL